MPTKEEERSTSFAGNPIVWVVGVAVIVIGGILLFSQGKPKTEIPVKPIPGPAPDIGMPENQDVRIFDISAKPFEFSVKEIRVKKGDRVKINLAVTQGMHDWVADEFGARTKIIQTGQSDSVEFTADKTGTFEYYCSVPTHRQQGMVGKLIVE